MPSRREQRLQATRSIAGKDETSPVGRATIPNMPLPKSKVPLKQRGKSENEQAESRRTWQSTEKRTVFALSSRTGRARGLWQLDRANVFEVEIRCGVVPLQAEVASLQA